MSRNRIAAIAAAVALRESCNVQDVPYATLSERLQRVGQVIAVRGSLDRPNQIV